MKKSSKKYLESIDQSTNKKDTTGKTTSVVRSNDRKVVDNRKDLNAARRA